MPLVAGAKPGTQRTYARGRCLVALPLAVALATSLVMSLAQLETVELPGCGSVSDCTRAAQSGWGKLPAAGWPLSFLGFAYFQSLAAAALIGSGRLSPLLRCVAMGGGAVSVFLIGVMLINDYPCGYCLVIHGSNLLLVGAIALQRWSRKAAYPTTRQTGCFLATFLVTSLLLGWLNRQTTLAADEATRSNLSDALDNAGAEDSASAFATGRYVLGPSDAQVHVTVVSDYQCPSCRRVDQLLRAMTEGRTDVAITARHFPFCTECNEHVDKTRHPNACRAALAAESAGIAGGRDAFWKMHDWLFEHSGQFTDEQLLAFIDESGIDAPKFQAALASPSTLATIQADTSAADARGLKFTPMVFINGRAIQIGK